MHPSGSNTLVTRLLYVGLAWVVAHLITFVIVMTFVLARSFLAGYGLEI